MQWVSFDAKERIRASLAIFEKFIFTTRLAIDSGNRGVAQKLDEFYFNFRVQGWWRCTREKLSGLISFHFEMQAEQSRKRVSRCTPGCVALIKLTFERARDSGEDAAV